MRGQAGIANARLAYAAYQQAFEAEPRYAALCARGARVQRPLWASTGVKSPAYPDTMYVSELVAPNTVSTIPEPTLEAMADHGVVAGDTVTGKAVQAQEVFDRLTAVGIDLPNVFDVLEHDGVSKFAASWSRVLQR